jgi:hypothetical protein
VRDVVTETQLRGRLPARAAGPAYRLVHADVRAEQPDQVGSTVEGCMNAEGNPRGGSEGQPFDRRPLLLFYDSECAS